MTRAEKAAGVVFPRLGSNIPPPVPVTADVDRFSRMADHFPFGGLVLFNADRETLPNHLATLQDRQDGRLLVTSDLERGAGQQIAGYTLFPHAGAFSRLGADAEAAAERFGVITAREARAAGVHVVFGPVADVNRDPHNPIIGTRAFGTDAGTASALCTAFIRGCQGAGLLATAKHFPGHGNTRTDSHAELPVVADAYDVLDLHDLAPFRASIEAGVALVMTAHVAYPALDPTGAPATVSRPILHDLLRTRLGFQGAVVTDSLIMGAVRDRYETEAERVAALLNAGVDIVLDPLDPPAAVAGILEAVDRGWISESRLDDALAHIEALRQRLRRLPTPDSTDPDAGAFAENVARQALSSVCHTPATLRRGPGTCWILLNPYVRGIDRPAPPLAGFVGMDASTSVIEVGRDDPETRYDLAREMAQHAGAVVVAAIVKPAAWHAFGLPEPMERLARTLLASRPAILAVLGSPQVMDAFPEAAVHLCAYSDVPASQKAVADHIQRTYLGA